MCVCFACCGVSGGAVKQHWVRACTLSQVAECRSKKKRRWFPVLNDTQKGERLEEGLTKVDMSSESSSTEFPSPTSEDGEAYQQRLLPPLALAIEAIDLLKLEIERGVR